MANLAGLQMEHTVDPRETTLTAFNGFVDTVKVAGVNVLVGIYEQPSRTKGGVIMPDGFNKEAHYTGVVGIVLMKGPAAFTEDTQHLFGDVIPEVGDWVVFEPSHSMGFKVGDRKCRLMEDVQIKMIVDAPDLAL